MAKKEKTENGGRSFRRLELMVPTFHWSEDNESEPIIGTIEKAVAIPLRDETRRAYHFRLSDPAVDAEGVEFPAGELVLIWHSAGLTGLEAYEGQEVRIAPKGFGKLSEKDRKARRSAPRIFEVDLVE